ncbi:MAG: glutathione S-transferase family protein [Proteobacteria bacterium]|nr:glutathione S-transferase family protein [Pseudomonadota bacterium]
MPGLVLHYHPLSSYCWKATIAIDALGIELRKQLLDLADPAQRDAYFALWPIGKMPLLMDEGRVIPESSIIIEHLQRHHAPHGRQLIPDDSDAALEVRLWDRFFDQYVMTPMQAHTADVLKPEAGRDPDGVARARNLIERSYAILQRHLEGRTWIAGDTFSMADCSAAPALFYANTYVPPAAEHTHLLAYIERLMDHPAVAATIDQSREWFKFYPGRAGLSRRYYIPEEA